MHERSQEVFTWNVKLKTPSWTHSFTILNNILNINKIIIAYHFDLSSF